MRRVHRPKHGFLDRVGGAPPRSVGTHGARPIRYARQRPSERHCQGGMNAPSHAPALPPGVCLLCHVVVPVGERQAGAHHVVAEIGAILAHAARDVPAVLVLVEHDALQGLALDLGGQGRFRSDTAAPRPASRIQAGLAQLERIDAVEPGPLAFHVDGVAIVDVAGEHHGHRQRQRCDDTHPERACDVLEQLLSSASTHQFQQSLASLHGDLASGGFTRR
jgi:hypothetical protein